ncbi:hypothetical protein EON82_11925 [bacterium]|nr:MAG: hypothetical protein EON82_11925 [bacterium]
MSPLGGKLTHYGAGLGSAPRPLNSMMTCQLTKLETALDQLKKAYPQLVPADAALLASALTLTGRHAIALYEGEQYVWPEDNEKLMRAMVPQVKITQEAIESNAPKRASKTAVEEEPVLMNVGLMPNLTAGENLLQGRDDLKTILSDILQEGVEFVYAPNDLGWQWALDRVNWTTIAGQEISKRVKSKTAFTEGAVGVEMNAGAKKRPSTKKSAAADVVADIDVPDEV